MDKDAKRQIQLMRQVVMYVDRLQPQNDLLYTALKQIAGSVDHASRLRQIARDALHAHNVPIAWGRQELWMDWEVKGEPPPNPNRG